jgi:hypothetical protein
MAVVRGWGRANVELFNKHRVSVFKIKKFQRLVAQQYECT